MSVRKADMKGQQITNVTIHLTHTFLHSVLNSYLSKYSPKTCTA